MKNMNEKEKNKMLNVLAKISIKTGERAVNKCFIAVNYEPKLPKELLEKK